MSNYRPMAALPWLAKLTEKVVTAQLQNFRDNNRLLDGLKSGFRPLHGTDTALVSVRDDVLQEADDNQVTMLILLDSYVTFDMVDHNTLLSQLASVGRVSGVALEWFLAFLEEQEQRGEAGGVCFIFFSPDLWGPTGLTSVSPSVQCIHGPPDSSPPKLWPQFPFIRRHLSVRLLAVHGAIDHGVHQSMDEL